MLAKFSTPGKLKGREYCNTLAIICFLTEFLSNNDNEGTEENDNDNVNSEADGKIALVLYGPVHSNILMSIFLSIQNSSSTEK